MVLLQNTPHEVYVHVAVRLRYSILIRGPLYYGAAILQNKMRVIESFIE